ncbi:hypothetical protein OF83DRAFT_1065431 [Amylostereum chailletii]|nr:hypothetical protein OF83DRAFT_1065431 [Amylostereum chailletii]
MHVCSKPLVLVDRNGYIMCAMHGRPDDPTWDEACGRVCLKLVDLGQRFYFNETDSKHRRGEYPCFHAGVSYGGGQKGPMNRKQASKGKQTEVDRLLADNDVIRLAGHGSASFATTAPKLFKKFDDTLNALCERDSKLKRPYPNSVWAATTFNLGGQVITTPHTDHRNLASGWCSITALGNFDPQAGGHLVLHSLGLIIEFPPNSECCILSACIVHSNTPVQPGEVRCSITQYSAGGLFQWVDSGFRKLGDLAMHDPQRKVEMEAADPTWWDTHISLLSKVEDLAADVSNVFGVEIEVDDSSGSV